MERTDGVCVNSHARKQFCLLNAKGGYGVISYRIHL